jgi:hypothetical protein
MDEELIAKAAEMLLGAYASRRGFRVQARPPLRLRRDHSLLTRQP